MGRRLLSREQPELPPPRARRFPALPRKDRARRTERAEPPPRLRGLAHAPAVPIREQRPQAPRHGDDRLGGSRAASRPAAGCKPGGFSISIADFDLHALSIAILSF